MTIRSFLKLLFSPRVIAGTVLVAVVLVGATLGLLWWTRPAPAPANPATAVFSKISAPTITPIPLTPTPAGGQTPTPTLPPSPSGEITLEGSVQISGTGGDGLRLRAEPGLESRVLFLALEGEIFQVKDGPQEAGGYNWWFLVAPYDSKVTGWAVANFLKVVPNP